MSWHGPSAPRVEGIATKSRVVASCASKPASTASRIFCLASAVIIGRDPPVADQITVHPQFAGNFGTAFQNRRRVPTLPLMTIARAIIASVLLAAFARPASAQTLTVGR